MLAIKTNEPIAKINQIPTFCFLGRCNEEITGIGRIIRVRSVTMFIDALENQSALKLKQWPAKVGFQNLDTGMQVKIALSTAHVYQTIRNPRIRRHVNIMRRKGKSLMYKMIIDDLVQPMLACINGTENHKSLICTSISCKPTSASWPPIPCSISGIANPVNTDEKNSDTRMIQSSKPVDLTILILVNNLAATAHAASIVSEILTTTILTPLLEIRWLGTASILQASLPSRELRSCQDLR